MFMYTEISMMTTSSIILVHRILISLNNLTVHIVKTSGHFYETFLYVILSVCKFHIHKFIMSKYSISVESFSRQGSALFFTIK